MQMEVQPLVESLVVYGGMYVHTYDMCIRYDTICKADANTLHNVDRKYSIMNCL